MKQAKGIIRFLLSTIRRIRKLFFWFLAVVGLAVILLFLAIVFLLPSPPMDSNAVHRVQSAAKEGRLAYRLTEPEELERWLGPADRVITSSDGGMQKQIRYWGAIEAGFSRMREHDSPFTLLYIKTGGTPLMIGRLCDSFGGRPIPIGQGRRIVLRNTEDLKKFDSFWGFQDASLKKLDLREQAAQLLKTPFDTRTEWPKAEKLPENFNPGLILEEGKNPGLGIRQLHKKGITGQGITIAILDQPLLKNHQEYADRLLGYETFSLAKLAPPQMHGPPVASIAVGKTCGAAPKAGLYYFAYPSWQWGFADCSPYCQAVEKILQVNQTLAADQKIRVISISFGGFSSMPNYDLWQKTVQKANKERILVVTCDSAFLDYGTLAHIPNTDPDDPANYRIGRYAGNQDVLRIPAGNRTTASHFGPDVYTYWTDGGMSWAAPYLAGLAALAFQVDPTIEPETIVDLWLQTAVKTEAGAIINPCGFLQAVKDQNKREEEAH